MAEVINLRTVRKRDKRRRHDQSARANRLAFGLPNTTERLKPHTKPKPVATSIGIGSK